MTQEQFKQLAELQNIFEKRCSEVTNILGKMDKYYNTGFYSCDTFRIDGGKVCCEGEDFWCCGEYEHYVEYFDAKLLSMTNEEIEKYVEEKIQIKLAEIKANEEELLKKKEAEERKQLEELKRKYE